MASYSRKQVAESIKGVFKQKGIVLNQYAEQKGITPTQIYSILNGESYISPKWALRFNQDLGLNMAFCIGGDLPIMDPEHEYDILLSAATAYLEAVEIVDALRDEFDSNLEVLSAKDKAKYLKAISDAQTKKIAEAAELKEILRAGWKEDDGGLDIVTEKLQPTKHLKLHEAIEQVILEAGRPLTYTEIARKINEQHLYERKRDNAPVPASQISARVKNYTNLFIETKDGGVTKVNIK